LVVFILSTAAVTSVYGDTDGNRTVLSVLDFTASDLSEREVEVYTDLLSTYIVRSGAYQVIDRRQREAILEQLEVSYSECKDERCQLEVGRLLSASQLVVGSVGQVGGWLIVSARRVEVVTGQTLSSASEKYPNLEALLDGARELALQVTGAADQNPGAASATTARSLISASNREELEMKLRRLKRNVDDVQYKRWLEQMAFDAYERQAPVEERLVFLEEYIAQTITRGHAIDLAVIYVPPYNREFEVPGGPETESGQYLGINTGWSYQLNSFFASGAYICLAACRMTSDDGGPIESGTLAGFWFGPTFVFGNRNEGLAVQVSPGIGGTDAFVLVLSRFGMVFRNIYLGYAGLWRFEEGFLTHGVEVGYSLFLGQRPVWPIEEGRRGRR